MQDLDLNTEDRVELDQTPFRLLLSTDVNLVRDAQIMEVQQSDDLIMIALQDKDPNAGGQIKLYLATKPELQLKAWVTKDAEGIDTRVEVSDLAESRPIRRGNVQDQPLSRGSSDGRSDALHDCHHPGWEPDYRDRGLLDLVEVRGES